MSHAPRILAFAGSSRKESYNKKLARIAAAAAKSAGGDVEFLDLRDFTLPLFDEDSEKENGLPENAVKLKKLFIAADGFLIAAPEYNSSITPLLKNTIDWIGRVKDDDGGPSSVYKTRVFALGSASPGALGGLRGLIVVRQTLELGLGALVLPDQIAVPRANDAFGDDGHLKDKGLMQHLRTVVQKLCRAARLMRGEEK